MSTKSLGRRKVLLWASLFFALASGSSGKWRYDIICGVDEKRRKSFSENVATENSPDYLISIYGSARYRFFHQPDSFASTFLLQVGKSVALETSKIFFYGKLIRTIFLRDSFSRIIWLKVDKGFSQLKAGCKSRPLICRQDFSEFSPFTHGKFSSTGKSK